MPEVAEVRSRGFMVGIDLGQHDCGLRLGQRVTQEARRRGAIIRPLGDVIILMPPLSISNGAAGQVGRDHRQLDRRRLLLGLPHRCSAARSRLANDLPQAPARQPLAR